MSEVYCGRCFFFQPGQYAAMVAWSKLPDARPGKLETARDSLVYGECWRHPSHVQRQAGEWCGEFSPEDKATGEKQ